MVVYTLEQRWEILIDLQQMPTLAKKNHICRWSSFWSWRICKQAKLSDLTHRKPTDIHWKADAPTTSHCFVRILVQRHNWTIFRKWARRGRYSQWRSLSGHVERIFIHNNWSGGYWQHLISPRRCQTDEATLDVLHPVFEDCIISRRADVVWPPRS